MAMLILMAARLRDSSRPADFQGSILFDRRPGQASAVDLCRAMGAFGLESDAAFGPAAAEQRRAMVAARLPRPEWPNKPMIVVAIDAQTGQMVALPVVPQMWTRLRRRHR